MADLGFWYGVIFTLLIETAALVVATEWLRKEVRNAKEHSVLH